MGIQDDKPIDENNPVPVKVVESDKPFDPYQPISEDNPLPIEVVVP